MLINSDSLIINGIKMAFYVTEVEFGYNKLWGEDTGKNLKGKTTGTFLGVVPKLKLNFRKTTQSELETLAEVLDEPWQTTTYYDPKLKRLNTIETYTGDWATRNRNTFSNVAKANESFNVSVIATEPRN